MTTTALMLVLMIMFGLSFFLGRQRSIASVGGVRSIPKLNSLPSYYGYWTALISGIPALLLLLLWLSFQNNVITGLVVAGMPEEVRSLPAAQLGLVVNDVQNVADVETGITSDNAVVNEAAEHFRSLQNKSRLLMSIFVGAIAILGATLAWWVISPKFRARNKVETITTALLFVSSTVAVFTTVGIVFSVLFEAIRFFQMVPVTDFLFGLEWSPQTAIRTDQVGSSGAFGAVPLFAGTLLISGIAMFVAVPIGLMSAIYIAEYASSRVRAVVKPALEILAGIPTVVYGFFAALAVAPFIRDMGANLHLDKLGIEIASESALAAGLVMGIMIIPFVSSLSDDAITAVPRSLREGSLGLGATRSETIRQVVLPAALPGIVGGVLLAVSRAIGETMIVVMAAGLSANLTANPFEAVTTITVQIVTLLVGDQEFDSPKTLAAFALGLVLFVITLILNVIALRVVRRYREQYD